MFKRFLFTVLIMGISSSLAQNTKKEFWVTAAAGYPISFIVGVGAEDVLGDVSVRAAIGASDDGSIDLLIDGLIDASAVDLSSPEVNPYGGLGVLFRINDKKDNSLHTNLLLGIEYRLTGIGLENMGIFMEIGPSFRLTPSFDTGLHGRAGINVHF